MIFRRLRVLYLLHALTPRRPICRARQLGVFFVSQGFVLDVIPKRWKNTPIEIKFPFFWKQVWLSKHSSLATIILRKKLGLIIHFMVLKHFCFFFESAFDFFENHLLIISVKKKNFLSIDGMFWRMSIKLQVNGILLPIVNILRRYLFRNRYKCRPRGYFSAPYRYLWIPGHFR